jgi:energy-coupling factor transport system substrate-specific component
MQKPIAGSTKFFEIMKFLITGGLAAAINWLARFGWQLIMPFAAAVVAAYLTGMAVSFFLYRSFVFPGSIVPVHVQTRNFFLVNLIGLSLTWTLSMFIVDFLFPLIGMRFYPAAIGHGIALAAPAITSWFGHRHLTFKHPGR